MDRSWRWIFVFIILGMACTTSSRARLGDNEISCALRYNHGKDVESTSADRHHPLLKGAHTTNKTYQYQGWVIQIGFMRGVAHRLLYRHEKPLQNITSEELRAILNANGGIDAWQVKSQDQNPNQFIAKTTLSPLEDSTWVRNDGAVARLTYPGNRLHLDSATYIRWSEKGKSEAPKPIPSF